MDIEDAVAADTVADVVVVTGTFSPAAWAIREAANCPLVIVLVVVGVVAECAGIAVTVIEGTSDC